MFMFFILFIFCRIPTHGAHVIKRQIPPPNPYIRKWRRLKKMIKDLIFVSTVKLGLLDILMTRCLYFAAKLGLLEIHVIRIIIISKDNTSYTMFFLDYLSVRFCSFILG